MCLRYCVWVFFLKDVALGVVSAVSGRSGRHKATFALQTALTPAGQTCADVGDILVPIREQYVESERQRGKAMLPSEETGALAHFYEYTMLTKVNALLKKCDGMHLQDASVQLLFWDTEYVAFEGRHDCLRLSRKRDDVRFPWQEPPTVSADDEADGDGDDSSPDAVPGPGADNAMARDYGLLSYGPILAFEDILSGNVDDSDGDIDSNDGGGGGGGGSGLLFEANNFQDVLDALGLEDRGAARGIFLRDSGGGPSEGRPLGVYQVHLVDQIPRNLTSTSRIYALFFGPWGSVGSILST